MFEFQKNSRLSWKHVLANFAVYQSELLLQEKQIGHLLQLLNSARSLLGNFNFEEDYFLERIFMYLDLNCFGNPLRTEYAPFFNRFLPLPTSPEKKKDLYQCSHFMFLRDCSLCVISFYLTKAEVSLLPPHGKSLKHWSDNQNYLNNPLHDK